MGNIHTCGIDDGKLFCWGREYNGRLGNGSSGLTKKDTPQQIGSSTSWQSIALGYSFTCGIDGGKLFCWGSDSSGQLGNGNASSASISTPQQIGSSTLWENIALGYYHACGIDDGKLFCWGRDNFSQLGNSSGSNANVDTPQQIGSSSLWESLALGNYHSCGIDSGRLFCWGNDSAGRVGNGSSSSTDVEFPQQIGSSNLWQGLALGGSHTCGINNAKLFCWGSDYRGQVGNGNSGSTDVASPQQIGSSNFWQDVALGGSHTCGIDNAKLYCWGYDSLGQTGNGSGSSFNFDVPQSIGSSSLWQKLSLGGFHTCGIDDGKLFCWGSDPYGQVGNGIGSSADIVTPQRVGSSNLWQSIALGYQSTCGIDDGKLFCWGTDNFGQVGNGIGSSTNIESPQQIGSSNLWQDLAQGSGHACGIDDGKLFCWGRNNYGQVGNGVSSSVNLETPQQIGSSNLWQDLSLGGAHTCGIDDGKLFCWGQDSDGQVGNGGGGADVTAPQQIGSSSLWEGIALGNTHTCGIDEGKLFCWGYDYDGQVGNGVGSSAIVETPQQIGSSILWQDISLGTYHTCGIDEGKLFCWGGDSEGQVGNGSGSSNVESPQQIGSSILWQNLAGGQYHSCGINDGKLFCWGEDADGQVGQSTSFLGSPFLIIE